MRHTRRGQDTDALDVDASACQPRYDGGFEELSGRSRVASDDSHRTMTLEGACLPEHVSGRDAEVYRQLSGQVAIGEAADAIGTEQTGHSTS
jgi:hypothetical protein